jgi:amino acid transporter
VAFFSLAVVVLNFQALAILQASSRFFWALSRDHAIPFSNVFYRVSRDRLPVAATWLAAALAAPMIAVLWIAPAIVPSVLYSAAGTYFTLAYVSEKADRCRYQPWY